MGKAILHDLRRNSISILIYSLLTTLILVAALMILVNYAYVKEQHHAMREFSGRPVYFLSLRVPHWDAVLRPTADADRVTTVRESLDEYLQHSFSKEGKGGAFLVLAGDRLGYRQIIILLGKYAEMTPFSMDPNAKTVFADDRDKQNKNGSSIRIESQTFPLLSVPEDMFVYHPYFYMNQSTGVLKDCLFIFSRDYNQIKQFFSPLEHTELLNSKAFLERMILDDPSPDELSELRKIICQKTSFFPQIISFTDYQLTTSRMGVRTHWLYMLFYNLVGILFIWIMLKNIRRILEQKCREYSIHYLFGADHMFTIVRMFSLAFMYQCLPLVGIFTVLKSINLADVAHILLVIFIQIIMTSIVVMYAYRDLFQHFPNSLRRE